MSRPPSLGFNLNEVSNSGFQAVDLTWSGNFTKSQAIFGWSLLAVCLIGIIWGSLPGQGWLPTEVPAWEIAVCLSISLFVRFLCGLVIYEYEGFQVAAALVANRKIHPKIEKHARGNIRSIQEQGALESLFGGRQLILVSTVLFPTVIEAAFYPLLPSSQVGNPDYYANLTKVTVKTFSFAVIICILAQVSSQIKAIGGPSAWMHRKTTKHVIKSVGFAEKLGLIIPSRLLAKKLSAHHDLDGQPGTMHEWSEWWSEKFAVGSGSPNSPPPFLLPPDHASHIMPHKVLNFLLDHQASPSFVAEIVPSFIGASVRGLDGSDAKPFWDWIDENEPQNFAANEPFIWRTGADSMGHIPPHHMAMVLLSSSLLILQDSTMPESEIDRLYKRFAEAAFGNVEQYEDYWSNVRKFRIGSRTPLASS